MYRLIKLVVTQASSAIPVVPLYVSLLFKIMQMGTHEGCIEQIVRMFNDRLYSGKDEVPVDEETESGWMIGRWIQKFRKRL